MSAASTDLDDIIDRYILKRLSEHEQSVFEIRLLDEPGLFAEVQSREQLVAGLKNYQSDTERVQQAAVESSRIVNDLNKLRLTFGQWIRLP